MLRYISGSVQAKIVGMLLVMFGLLAVTVALNFNTFGSLEGSGPSIDQACAQRMRTFKLATLAGDYDRSGRDARVTIGAQLEQTIAQFEDVQVGLAVGSDQYKLLGTDDSGILAQLGVVDQSWETYKANITTILESDTRANEALSGINEDAAGVFKAAANVVNGMSASQIPTVNINQAGAQRMRAYKMAFLVDQYVSTTGAEQAQIGQDLVATIGQFDAVQNGLREGGGDFGLTETTALSILEKISAVDAAWASFKMNIDLAMSGDHTGEERVREQVAPLFQSANNVVASMDEMVIPLQAIDQAGGQRMRVFKLAFLANSYPLEDDEAGRTEITQEIMVTMDQFEGVQTGIRQGSSALGLTRGIDDPAVVSAQNELDVVWAAYRDEIERSLTFDFEPLAALAGIGQMAPGLFDDANETVALVTADSEAVIGSLKQLEIILMVIAIVILAAAVRFIQLKIVRPLVVVAKTAQDISELELPKLGSALEAMANGDLTQSFNVEVAEVKIESSDEIGQIGKSFNSMIDRLQSSSGSFNLMTSNIRSLIGEVGATAQNLNGASAQLASAAQQAGQATQGITDTSQQLANGAQQQTESVDSTTAAIGQLTKAINQIAEGSQEQASQVEQASNIVGQVSKAATDVAENAQSAASGCQEANEAARSGSEMVGKTVEGMQKIEAAVNMASEKITDLGTQSAEIGKIVAVIDDIAAQTNLLALNAAIEAARAGEQGRGFAVVADEVRKLAERVTEATKEIANLIDTVQKGVDESIKATEDGAREVADGAVQAQEAGKILEQILSPVESVSVQVDQISAAAQEVSASSEEMVKTIENVSSVVEQNSAAAEQMTANSDEVLRSIENVSGITEQSSAAAQEMSASSEEMSAQVEEVVSSAETLSEMSVSLQKAVSVFNVGNQTVVTTNGSAPAASPQDMQYPEAPEGSPAVDEEMAMRH